MLAKKKTNKVRISITSKEPNVDTGFLIVTKKGILKLKK